MPAPDRGEGGIVAVNYLGSAIDYLLGGVTVGGASEARLRRWFALPDADLVLPHGRARYVVVDVETRGTGRRRERLISIGAVALAQMRIPLADCFSAVLRQDRASAGADILVHGVGGQTQLAGAEPALAMLDFLDHLGKAPLVAFEADRDRAAIERAVKSILGVPFRHPWIDLGALLPAVFPKDPCTTLDQWLARFGLGAGTWHDAPADALVLAQLLQAALDAASRAGLVNARQLLDLRRAKRAADR